MWYSYAVIKVVPRVERGECVNVGVILFAREDAFLGVRIELDRARLAAFSPGVDVASIERHLTTFLAISQGDRSSGPIAELPPAERFHWLTAPRSTVIQTSAIHVGQTDDPDAALDELLDEFVRLPEPA
ncbi:MAG TPA: DUF3037 domain-containing protein [Thermomicrobiales bacterium]|nr:DUF3037 domain-containing protein [Thermomicrobiales bacterium]